MAPNNTRIERSRSVARISYCLLRRERYPVAYSSCLSSLSIVQTLFSKSRDDAFGWNRNDQGQDAIIKVVVLAARIFPQSPWYSL